MTETYPNNAAAVAQIEEYLEQGYVVIPLKDKIPVQNNWQKLKHENVDKRQFRGYSSFGFQIPKNIVVLDVDNHKGSNIGSESLKLLSEEFGIDFEKECTFVVKTAGGGLHLYFKLPSSVTTKLVNALPEFRGLEFKSVGRQVVMPESVLSNGKKYEVLKGNIRKLIELPSKKLLAKITSKREVAKKTSEVAIADFSDLETDISVFKTSLEKYAEIPNGSRNNELFKIACSAKNLGLSPRCLLPILEEWQEGVINPPLQSDELKTTILNAYNYSSEGAATKSVATIFGKVEKMSDELLDTDTVLWTDKLIRTKSGEPSTGNFGTKNTELFLENLPEFKGKLGLNLFTMDTVWLEMPEWRHKIVDSKFKQEIENPEDADKIDKQPPLTDDDIVIIRGILNEHGFDPTPNKILEAVRATAIRNPFHPVKEYFEALPEWDGVKRLENFFHHYCNTPDNAYFSEVGKKIFTAVVTRIYRPGAKFDYTPIFVGEQGKAKSQLIKALAIKPIWFTDTLGDIENKDVILQMRAKLIIENAEMAMTGKKAMAIQKAFLSRSTDRARLPYERLPRDIPRQCIFIATTNEDQFLHDETGNRRMWPIEMTELRLAEVRRDIDLFYAEAIHLFKKGEMLYLEDDVEKMANVYQAERYAADEWQNKIDGFLNKDYSDDFVKGSDIWMQCLGRLDISTFDIKNQKRVSNILRVLHWKSSTKRIGDHTVRGYRRPEKNI